VKKQNDFLLQNFVRNYRYCVNNQISTQLAANQILVIFETKIFTNQSSIFHLFNSESTDLNSGQLVRVASTRKPITHLGAFEASAVKLTIGSRKNQLIRSITTPNGKYSLELFMLLGSSSS